MARGGTGRPIGEVLEELRDDFPDVSVSKIRFLEAQGLINPQRTPAGYRQFTDEDVRILRWILLQQRDHYLPLKVIRRRLREGNGPGSGGEATPSSGAPAEPAPVGTAGEGSTPASEDTEAPPAAWYLEEDTSTVHAAANHEPAESLPAVTPAAPARLAPVAAPVGQELWDAGRGGKYSRVEIALEAGLDESALAELESFGLLRSDDLDDEALTVARLAAGFFAYGVEARHLRMYKSFAEREAAFLEQVVAPMVNSRQEGARERARESLAELARLGQALRLSMLRTALGPTYGD